MAGNVELGHHANAAIVRIGDEVANLLLRVVAARRTLAVQLREMLALDAEALVVGKMPVQARSSSRRPCRRGCA